jgi:molybdopterin-guanine dinucleotide biosynthesis protein A
MMDHRRDGISARDAPLGAILAGGASRRFGAPKALARVGARTIAERVRDALDGMLDRVVVIANDPDLLTDLHLPTRPDRRPGKGPLAGVETALRWAIDEGRPSTLVAACDMPFLDARALRLLIDAATGDAAAFAGDPRPPLCVYLATSCLAAVERLLEGDGDRSMRALLDAVDTAWVPEGDVGRFIDPATMFFNVNTPDDLRRAEEIDRELDARA